MSCDPCPHGKATPFDCEECLKEAKLGFDSYDKLKDFSKAADNFAVGLLHKQIDELRTDMLEKVNTLLTNRLEKHLGRKPTEEDMRKCRITELNTFVFEDTTLMRIYIGELEWDGFTCKQEIKYIDI